MTPSIGRIVHYSLTESVADSINKRRSDRLKKHPELEEDGSQLHVGNPVKAGDIFPLIVVRVWSNSLVNGQVVLDGNDTYWVTSIAEADLDADPQGRWFWPPRV